MPSLYNRDELKDILTTAVEGGIGYWAALDNHLRDPDGSWVCITVVPSEEDDEFERKTIDYLDLKKVTRDVANGQYNLREDIVQAVKSGDPGNIDAEAADCLVQIACFGEVVYG